MSNGNPPWGNITTPGTLSGSVTTGSSYNWPPGDYYVGGSHINNNTWSYNRASEKFYNDEILETLSTIIKYGVPSAYDGWDNKTRERLDEEIRQTASDIVNRINKDNVKDQLKDAKEPAGKYTLRYAKEFAILNTKIKIYIKGINENTISS